CTVVDRPFDAANLPCAPVVLLRLRAPARGVVPAPVTKYRSRAVGDKEPFRFASLAQRRDQTVRAVRDGCVCGRLHRAEPPRAVVSPALWIRCDKAWHALLR